MNRNIDEMLKALQACVEVLEEVPCVSNKQEAAKVNAKAAIRNYYCPVPGYLPSRHPARKN